MTVKRLKCAICKEAISQTDAWRYWRDRPAHDRCIPKLNQAKGIIGEYVVIERLQAAGFETYQAIDVDGIDILARREGVEATIQVKFGNRIRDHRWQIGGKHGSAANIRKADWLIAVLPDHRIYIVPKRLIPRGKAFVRFDDRTLLPFDPFNFKLFTDVEVLPNLEESDLAHILPVPKPGYANTAAYYPSHNKAEVYLREVLRVLRKYYSTEAEMEFIWLVVLRITRNVIHEMCHAADPTIRGPRGEDAINETAMRMTL